MGTQTITTPAGEEMVVMPRSEYEALLASAEEAFEDGADAAAFAAAMAASSPEDILPPEVSAQILNGKGRLCVYREWRDQTLPQVARASGLSEERLNQIEAGEHSPSREEAASIADVLEIPLAWLI